MGFAVTEHCYELDGSLRENAVRDVGDETRVHCPCDFTTVGHGVGASSRCQFMIAKTFEQPLKSIVSDQVFSREVINVGQE
jgi:hypothetical protein